MPTNPFVYDQAHIIPDPLVADYYVDDHNHGRLLRSPRNVFLVGERGSGKTMALLYNSLPIQRLVAEKSNVSFDLDFIGVLIPANTPLTHRREYKLLKSFHASVVSEHFLSLAIAFHISDALRPLVAMVTGEEQEALRSELEFYFGFTIPKQIGVFDAICQVVQRESVEAQKTLNRVMSDEIYPQSLSFASLVVPLMRAIKKVEVFRDSHFMLMVDDAHNLNEFQLRALNSWIAYRDRKLFSFKVATARVAQLSRTTASGGDILEGHDFLTIDMERPIHNEASDYGRFAEKVVSRRLERVGISATPTEFFPVHPKLAKDVEEAASRVRARVVEATPDRTSKQIVDYVYKQKWAEYFRSRHPKANRPQYSGFTTLMFLSTGVIRNLLEPCWWMWDAAISELPEDARPGSVVNEVSPRIQAAKILDRSDAAWERMKFLDVAIDGCSHADGEKIRRLFEELAAFFFKRLMSHTSEPSATSFSLSAKDDAVMAKLQPLLDIAQRAQLLYVRSGPAKTRGRREEYYVPNRVLWPSRGLDPHGQHARASIRAVDLLNAANGKAIPVRREREGDQENLFSEGDSDE